VEQLRRFVNVRDDDQDSQWRLFIGCLVAAFRPNGPYPILALNGEHGSAKSTPAKIHRRLIEPNKSVTRAAPRDVAVLRAGRLARDSHPGPRPCPAHGIGASGRAVIGDGRRPDRLPQFLRRFRIRMDVASSNPCDALERPKTVQSVARSLSADELPASSPSCPTPCVFGATGPSSSPSSSPGGAGPK
jgi:hypothetical protein